MRWRLAIYFILAATVWPLSGCSIYKGEGRKKFEERSQGRVSSQVGISSECWKQPASDALWNSGSERKIIIKNDPDSKTILACLEDINE